MAAMTPDEFWAILHNVPDPKPVFYRLYYNEQGYPVCYSTEDLPGTYIEIDQATFNLSDSKVKVKNGQLVKITWKTTSKVVPGEQGVACHPEDVSVIVDSVPNTKWSKHSYESN